MIKACHSDDNYKTLAIDMSSHLFDLSNPSFEYTPFPYGLIANIFDPEIYQQLLDNWPSSELFNHKKKWGDKYSFSETENPAQYHRFISGNKIWNQVYGETKEPHFIDRVLNMLANNNIDLGLRQNWHPANNPGLGCEPNLTG